MKNNAVKIFLASLICFSVSACTNNEETVPTNVDPSPQGEEVDPQPHIDPTPIDDDDKPEYDVNGFYLEKVGDIVETHSEIQEAYLKDSYANISTYASGTEEKSKPHSIELKWDFDPVSYKDFQTFTLQLSDNDEFLNPEIFTTRNYSVNVKNLKVATKYSWKVIAVYKTSTVESGISTFTTCDSKPRNLDVDGVTNFRDLGGYSLPGNKKVKQGLLYRSAKFDSNSSTYVTSQGIRTATEQLGIKTEIDLRDDVSKVSSCLGNDVNYYNNPMIYNNFPAGTNMATANLTSLLKTFRTFANPESYPIDYHCNIGTDRTGMVSVLLLGLLGVDMDSIVRDYLFSNFANIGGSRIASGIDEYTNYIKNKFEGSSLSDKIEKFLIQEVGITSVEINSIKDILVI